MDTLDIIDEYNRNIRTKTSDETWDIYLKRISEYKKSNPYASDFAFMYPDVFGWDEHWLENMRNCVSPYELAKETIRKIIETHEDKLSDEIKKLLIIK